MNKLFLLIEKAKHSPFYLKLLNVLLLRRIPFNRPHGLKITAVNENGFTVFLPYKRKNLNHLHGIHACALGALAEYTAGITLLYKLHSEEYRLIMKNIAVVFHFQAKADVSAECAVTEKWIDEKIITPLQNTESAFVEMNIEIFDVARNHICTTTVNWQVKKWNAVKTS